jgi:hypothetical protein
MNQNVIWESCEATAAVQDGAPRAGTEVVAALSCARLAEMGGRIS